MKSSRYSIAMRSKVTSKCGRNGQRDTWLPPVILTFDLLTFDLLSSKLICSILTWVTSPVSLNIASFSVFELTVST